MKNFETETHIIFEGVAYPKAKKGITKSKPTKSNSNKGLSKPKNYKTTEDKLQSLKTFMNKNIKNTNEKIAIINCKDYNKKSTYTTKNGIRREYDLKELVFIKNSGETRKDLYIEFPFFMKQNFC